MRAGFALLGAALLAATPASSAIRYSVTDVGSLGAAEIGGTIGSFGTAINASGELTGYSFYDANNSLSHAFLYDGSKMIDLGDLGGGFSWGYGINDLGQVTGESYTPGGGPGRHAFLYDGGKMIDLGTLGGPISGGLGINNAGQVAGYSWTATNETDAFLYEHGSMISLGEGSASGINNAGQVVGLNDHLGTLGGFYTGAFAINDLGQKTGYSDTFGAIPFDFANGVIPLDTVLYPGDGAFHAFISDGNGMTDLGTIGQALSVGYGINNRGQVVGGLVDITAGGIGSAFLYDGKRMADLNSLVDPRSGWSIVDARGINDAGQIVAFGTNPNVQGGGGHALLLTPISGAVPEPAAWTMMIAGFGAVGAVARRKRTLVAGWHRSPVRAACR